MKKLLPVLLVTLPVAGNGNEDMPEKIVGAEAFILGFADLIRLLDSWVGTEALVFAVICFAVAYFAYESKKNSNIPSEEELKKQDSQRNTKLISSKPLNIGEPKDTAHVPATIPCEVCSRRISKNSVSCPNCGHPTASSICFYLDGN
jgi:hypothetical protein